MNHPKTFKQLRNARQYVVESMSITKDERPSRPVSGDTNYLTEQTDTIGAFVSHARTALT